MIELYDRGTWNVTGTLSYNQRTLWWSHVTKNPQRSRRSRRGWGNDQEGEEEEKGQEKEEKKKRNKDKNFYDCKSLGKGFLVKMFPKTCNTQDSNITKVPIYFTLNIPKVPISFSRQKFILVKSIISKYVGT